MPFIITLCWLLATTVVAAPIQVKVIKFKDGDTLTVSKAGIVFDVRLVNVDTPEIAHRCVQGVCKDPLQPYGLEAAEALKTACTGAKARLDIKGRDPYGRQLGELYCGVNINEWLVKSGWAWYTPDKRYTPKNDLEWRGWEKAARQERKGLWQDRAPIDPYVWRHRCHGC